MYIYVYICIKAVHTYVNLKGYGYTPLHLIHLILLTYYCIIIKSYNHSRVETINFYYSSLRMGQVSNCIYIQFHTIHLKSLNLSKYTNYSYSFLIVQNISMM